MKPGVDYIGVSVGALILNEKGEVLLVKRSQNARNEKGKWEAPGGAVEFWETRETAVRREIMEELGVEVEIIKVLVTTDEILPEYRQHWLPTTFLAKVKNGQTAKIVEPEKHDAIGWFAIGALPSPLSYITSLDIAEYQRHLQK